MKAIIDTSSLLSFCRYYLPFDKNSHLFNLIKNKIEFGDIIVIDKVMDECAAVANGHVLTSMPYLKDPKFLKGAKCPVKTDTITASNHAQFLEQVDRDFQDQSLRRLKKINEAEYVVQKGIFMNSADMRMILTCLNLKERGKKGEEVILVSEESRSLNDSKIFKKIPIICNYVGIQTLTLPRIFEHHYKLKVQFS